jgi:retron-type reverse transcriptase
MIKNIYQELFNEANYKIAYEQIKSKPGNMIEETLDGINKEWINQIIQKMKDCSFQFKPSKRIYIPKENGNNRAIGISSPRDKIIQKVILNILEKEFENIFSTQSHGFRPKKGCHTALKEVRS